MKLGFKKGDFIQSEKFHRNALSLPIFPTLKKSECKKVVDVIFEIINND